MPISKLIIDFLEYLEIEKGRSSLTAKNYDHYLKVFAEFAKTQNVETADKIDHELIRQFHLNLNRTKIYQDETRSKTTQNYYLIAIRSFLKYLSKRGILSLAPEKIELAKTGDRQITFLTEEELDDLLSEPDNKTIQGLRDKAILDLLFSTGLRVSELSNLKKKDINLEKQEFSIKGKGSKVRVVFLDETAKTSIVKYLEARHDQSEYLFIGYGHVNNPKNEIIVHGVNDSISDRSIQRMIKKYALQAGITKDVTPHVFRHTFATDLLMNGADLRAVQSLLGHSSVTTTQIYTHVTDQHLQDVHQAFHGKRRKDESED